MHLSQTSRKRLAITLSILFFMALSAPSWGQSRIPANPNTYLQVVDQTNVGDTDLYMVSFFEVPLSQAGPIYIGINHPGLDNSANIDQGTGGNWHFALVGGTGAITHKDSRLVQYWSDPTSMSGTGSIIQNRIFTTETGWHYFDAVMPSQGEKVGNAYIFKVVAKYPDGTGTGRKNSFQLIASSDQSPTSPAEISGVRSFAYAWTLALNGYGAQEKFDLYPFIPEGGVNSLGIVNHDLDHNGGGENGDQYHQISNFSGANGPWPQPLTLSDDNQTEIDNFSVGTDTNGTWHWEIFEGTAGFINPAVFWAIDDNGTLGGWEYEDTDPVLRTYAAPYLPAAADHVIADPASQFAALGTPVTLGLQLVDAAGNSVPYVRGIFVSVAAGSSGNISINGGGNTALITTSAEGYASFTIQNDTAELIELVLQTDGADGSSSLPGAASNSAPEIEFLVSPPVQGWSAANTFFASTELGNVVLPVLTIRNETGASLPIGSVVSVRIPTGLSGLQFDSLVTPTLGIGATAAYTDAFTGTNNVLELTLTGALADLASFTITGLELLAGTYSGGSGYLEFSRDGTNWVSDDKIISISGTNYTWTGAVDGDWSDAGNWSGAAPSAGDGSEDISIPTGLTNYPLLPNAPNPWVFGDLTIEAGARMSVGAADFTVAGTFANDGEVILTAAGVPSDQNSVDPDSGTVVYASASGGSVAALDYYNLQLDGAGTFTAAGDIGVTQTLILDGGTLASSDTITLEGQLQRTAGGIASSGRLLVSGALDRSLDLTGSTLGNVEIDSATHTITLASGLLADGNIVITAGTLDAASYDIRFGGNFSNSDTFAAGTAALVFTGAGTGTLNTGGATLNDLGLDTATGTLQLNSVTTVTIVADSLVRDAGTLDLNGQTLQIAADVLYAAGSIIDVASGGTLVLNGSGDQSAALDAMTAGGLDIVTRATGTVDISGNPTLDSLAAAAGAYSLTLDNATVTAAAATTLANTGALSLQVGATFAGGLTATSQSSIVLGGTLQSDGGDIDFSGRVLQLAASTIIDTELGDDAAAGNLVLGADISAQNTPYDLQIDTGSAGGNGGTITLGSFSAAAGQPLASLDITSAASGADGALNSAAAIALSVGVSADLGAEDLDMTNAANSIPGIVVSSAGQVDLATSGALTVQAGGVHASADITLTSTGLLSVANAVDSSTGSLSLSGSGIAAGATISSTLSNVSLTAGALGITQSAGSIGGDLVSFDSAAAIGTTGARIQTAANTISATSGTNFFLRDTDGFTWGSAADSEALSGTVNLSTAGPGDIVLAYDQSTGLGGPIILNPVGSIVLAGSLTTTGPSIAFQRPITLAGTPIIGSGGSIIFDAAVNADDAGTQDRSLGVNATGAVTFNNTVGTGANGSLAGLTVINSAGTTFTDDVNVSDGAATVTLTATTGSIAFQGETEMGTLATAAAGYNLSFTGPSLQVTTATTLAHTGTLSIENLATFAGGLTATAQSNIELAGTLQSTGTAIALGDLELHDDVSIETAGGALSLAAVDADAAANDRTLLFDAGAVTLGGDIGAVEPLYLVISTAATQISSSVINISAPVYLAIGSANTTIDATLSAAQFVFFSGNYTITGSLTANPALLPTLNGAGDIVVFGANYDSDDPDRQAYYIDATTQIASAANNNLYVYPQSNSLRPYTGGPTYTAASGEFSIAPSASFANLAGGTLDTSAGNFYVNGVNLDATAAWNLALRDNTASTPLDGTTPFGPVYAVLLNGDVQNANESGPGVLSYGLAYGGSTPAVATISSVAVITDSLLRIAFSEAIENSSDEIQRALDAGLVWYADNNDATTPALHFGTAYIIAEPADFDPTASSSFDETLLVAAREASTLLSDTNVVYLEISNPGTALERFRTDAVGSAIGASNAASTDRSGQTGIETIPNIFFVKGAFFTADRRTPVQNYGYNNVPTPFDQASDRANPYLYEIRYGRAPIGQAASADVDGHNFFELRYSEPMVLGSLAANATNVRAEATFLDGTEFGGQIADNATDAVEIVGYFTYTDGSYSSADPLLTGVRSGAPDPTNALYWDTFSDFAAAPIDTDGTRLQIFISGYHDGTGWPGWHWGIPDPSAATQVTVAANAAITDLAGNSLNDVVSTAEIANTLDFAADVTGSLAADFDPPAFSPFGTNYELVSRSTDITGLTNQIDIFILDNSSDAGTWDPINDHPEATPGMGVRDQTWSSYLGLTPELAFEVHPEGGTGTQYARSLGTDIENNLFEPMAPFSINLGDDPYFRLQIDTDYGFGPLSEIELAYDYTAAYITDLAGNLLREPGRMSIIDRDPPRITLALAAVGGDRIYIEFNRPSYGDNAMGSQPAAADFTLQNTTLAVSSVDLVRTYDQGGAVLGVWSMYLNLDGKLSADDIYDGEISITGIYDSSNNNLNSTRILSDVAIGTVVPVYATDGYTTTDPDSFDGQPFQPLRSFDGSGTLRDRDIILQASIVAASQSAAPLSLVYDLSVPGSLKSDGGFWANRIIAGLVDTLNSAARTASIQGATNVATRTFRVPSSDSEMQDGSILEFVFELDDRPVGWVADNNDPLAVQPWSVRIGSGVTQRAGVTIVNNVLNPIAGDTTALVYTLGEAGMVSISVFTLDGNLVKVLQRGPQASGSHSATWDGTNTQNRVVARGIYFLRIVAPGIDEYRRVLIVRP